MIYLGYSISKQLFIVRWREHRLTCANSPRAKEILDGLYAVSKKTTCRYMWPYSHVVHYSPQAWADLLSVAQ